MKTKTHTHWNALPEQEKDDLLNWFNSTKPSQDDKRKLSALYHAGKFHAWDCPSCGERVYWGDPDEWDDFQGVRQADFTSYPGCDEYFHPRLIAQQCDSCRMNCPSLSDLNMVGIGEPSYWPEDNA